MGMIACLQMVDNQCINQLLEKDADELFEEIEEMQEADDSVLDLDKMWDGLHFVLTGVTACEPIEGNPLSESIVGKSKFIDDDDTDFIAYSFSENLVDILDALRDFDIDKAIDGFQPKDFRRNNIYPDIWLDEDKEGLQKELRASFFELKSFYEKAVEYKKGIVVSIY